MKRTFTLIARLTLSIQRAESQARSSANLISTRSGKTHGGELIAKSKEPRGISILSITISALLFVCIARVEAAPKRTVTIEGKRASRDSLLARARQNEVMAPDVARTCYRELLAAAPSWPAAVEGASRFFCELSARNNTKGTHIVALADAEEALTLAELLKAMTPASPSALHLLSITHTQMGDVLNIRRENGDLDKVGQHYNLALAAAEEMLKEAPNSLDATWDLAVSCLKLGDFVLESDPVAHWDKAKAYHSRGLAKMESLIQSKHDTAKSVGALSRSLEILADLEANCAAEGYLEKALASLTRCLSLRDEQLKVNPTSAQARQDVIASLDKLADFLESHKMDGAADKASTYRNRSLAMKEALLTMSPTSIQATWDVSNHLDKLADLILKTERFDSPEKALGHLTRSLELRQKVLKENPDSFEATWVVSHSLTRLGDMLIRASFETPKPHYEPQGVGCHVRSVEVWEAFLKVKPDSQAATAELSKRLESLYNFLTKRHWSEYGDDLLPYFARDLESREVALKSNPTSVAAMTQVLTCCGRLAALTSRRRHEKKVSSLNNRVLDLTESLLKANPDSPDAIRNAAVWNLVASFRSDDSTRHRRAAYEVLKSAVERAIVLDANTLNYYEMLKIEFAR